MTIQSYATTLEPSKHYGVLLTDVPVTRGLNIEVSRNKMNSPNIYSPSSTTANHLLATVAHDLRNPLGATYTFLSMLMDDNNLKDEQREILALMKESTCYSLKLVEGLLQTHKTEQEKVQTDVDEVIQACVKVLQPKASEKELRLNYISSGNQEMANIDRNSICRVVSNLISNAIKFTETGGKITITLSGTVNNLLVSVRDNGIGIPLNLRNKIFSEGCKVGREGTNGEESFGLGLPICRRIIDQHGGKINFTSTPSKGSTFYFTLPKVMVK
jgi:two-component system sensor histidine kinase VicK